MDRIHRSPKLQTRHSGNYEESSQNSFATVDAKQLLCLCNDNNQCVRNPPPKELLEPVEPKKSAQLQDVAKTMGHCVTTSEGGCYTVKDIDLNALREFHKMKNAGKPDLSSAESPIPQEALRYRELGSSSTPKPDSELNVERFIHVRYGCLASHSKLTLSCKGHLVNHLVPKAISCCNTSNFCNAGLTPEFMHHASNLEAYKAALVNHKLFDQNSNIIRRPRINSELNIGPNLLSGGEIIYDSPSQRVAETPEKNIFDKTHTANSIMIVAFSIVLAFLTLTMLGVYYCYKHRLQKKKLKVLESILWYPSPHSQYMVAKRRHSHSSNIEFSNQNQPSKIKKNLQKVHIALDPSRPVGCSSHTATTSLTRTVAGSDELRGPQCIKTNRSYSAQYTVSKQIYLEKFIGRGKFSDVWTGTWRGETIMAKIYNSNDRLAQCVWRRTTNAYRSMLLRHQTTQGLIAADWVCYPQDAHKAVLEASGVQSIFTAPTLCAMLIGELHQWGTLKDLMSQCHWTSYATEISSGDTDNSESVHRVFQLTRRDGSRTGPLLTATDELMLKIVMRLAISITQGLCFLHSEFAGTRGKPGLAHRDLKPSNIFIKSDWTCCIGDIGFAIRALPNPSPVSPNELHRMFMQYVSQPQLRAYVGNQHTHCTSTTVREGRSTGGGVTEEPPLETLHPGSANQQHHNFETGEVLPRRSANLTLDKMELLDWWPVGGLHISTPRYMAPEILSSTLSPFCFEGYQRSDVYSLSLILWELITWALPQSQTSIFDTVQKEVDNNERRQPFSTIPRGSVAVDSVKSGASGDEAAHHLAYQREWREYCNHLELINGRRSSATFIQSTQTQSSWMNSSLEAISNPPVSTQAGLFVSNEPDIQTMYSIVCERNLRPQLPFALENETQGLAIQLNSSKEVLGNSVPLINPALLHTLTFSQIPKSTSGDKTDTPGQTVVGESSSSGASSLKGTHMSTTPMMQSEIRPSHLELTELNRVVLHQFSTLLPECWASNPDSRLTALRIRKKLQRISDQLDLQGLDTRGLTTRTPTPNITAATGQFRCHVQSDSSTITNAL